MPNKTQKKISVIIADDDFTIRDAFRECVKNSRYEIAAEAEDGMTAIEAARKIKPDMAVLDIEMPVADGITACGILMKENLVHCTVMLTSFETGDYINAAIESGAEGYITKPFERGQLLSVLDMCYAQSKERYMLKKDCTNLKRKLDSKEITNKAKLIVMEKRGLDENDAYKYLREMSKRKGVSVETVAEMIIAEWENHRSE
ncbi:MAG: response regulator [Methanocorpusculum sp.]|nr:response regulator [Methanocorpusculum sp.]